MSHNVAEFSPCREYRYTLWRYIRPTDLFAQTNAPVIRYSMFIGLNPSTADEVRNDNTVRRCINYSADWGYDALCMTNMFGYRATEPNDMKAQSDPNGPDNDYWLRRIAENASVIVCAWGTHGVFRDRESQVLDLLSDFPLHALKITSKGHPNHPLYLKKSLLPVRWR